MNIKFRMVLALLVAAMLVCTISLAEEAGVGLMPGEAWQQVEAGSVAQNAESVLAEAGPRVFEGSVLDSLPEGVALHAFAALAPKDAEAEDGAMLATLSEVPDTDRLCAAVGCVTDGIITWQVLTLQPDGDSTQLLAAQDSLESLRSAEEVFVAVFY